MQIIKSLSDANALKDNRIIGAQGLTLKNSEIRFSGKGNILFCEKKVTLVNSQLKFNGDNCIIYLSENSHYYYLDVTVYRNSAFFMGKDNYMNGAIHAVLSEQKNIIIGNDNLFSFGIWMRTADPHLVYSAETHRRINPSKSVFLGDHVWIGQGAMILKGSRISSGSILGAMAVCSKKSIESNTSWGGNPAKKLSDNVFWSSEAVHMWDDETTASHESFNDNCYIFNYDKETNIPFSEIDSRLSESDTDKKLEFLKELSKNESKNRFASNYEV